jgi:shikimate kinase
MPWRQPNTIAVTYTHGYAVIPADIVAVVCKLAQAKWSNPQGFKTAAAGAISLSLDSGVTAGALDDADKAILDSYRRRRRSVQLAARLI